VASRGSGKPFTALPSVWPPSALEEVHPTASSSPGEVDGGGFASHRRPWSPLPESSSDTTNQPLVTRIELPCGESSSDSTERAPATMQWDQLEQQARPRIERTGS
jgi:hypothetical protein